MNELQPIIEVVEKMLVFKALHELDYDLELERLCKRRETNVERAKS